MHSPFWRDADEKQREGRIPCGQWATCLRAHLATGYSAPLRGGRCLSQDLVTESTKLWYPQKRDSRQPRKIGLWVGELLALLFLTEDSATRRRSQECRAPP